jgi:hypothetical protein
VKLYALIVALLMAPATVAMAAGLEPGIAISASIILAFGVAVGSMVDLLRLYLSTPRPRSKFFRMLIDANAIKLALFSWFAYLLVVGILDRLGYVTHPIPDMGARQFIGGLVSVVFLSATTYYAIRSRRIIADLVPTLNREVQEVPRLVEGSDGEPLAPDS